MNQFDLFASTCIDFTDNGHCNQQGANYHTWSDAGCRWCPGEARGTGRGNPLLLFLYQKPKENTKPIPKY